MFTEQSVEYMLFNSTIFRYHSICPVAAYLILFTETCTERDVLQTSQDEDVFWKNCTTVNHKFIATFNNG